MGLITGLLTLPLAPVRGTVWIAERVLEQAEREAGDEDAIRRQLLELEMRRDLGEIDEVEYIAEEERLLAALARSRRVSTGQNGDETAMED